MTEILQCKQCGGDYTQKPSGRPKLYCSRSCALLYWRLNNKERRKELNYIHSILKYGISVEEYESRLLDQDYKCAICRLGTKGKTSQSRLHIDHDHITGEVRGLLCSKCNTGLGLFNDDIILLQKAQEYLNDP
jgi:hypothetical protein